MREFSLLDILKYYCKKFWVILIVTILTVCVGQLYTNKYFVPKYEESSTIILGAGTDDNLEISYSTISLYDSLIKNYMELLESDKLLSSVIEELKLGYSTSEFSNMIDYKVHDEAQMVKVSVKNENDKMAADICNKLVEKLKEQVKDVYDMDNIAIVDKAKPTGNLTYSKNEIIIICVILGIFLSSILIIIKFIFSNRLTQINTLKTPNIVFLGEVKFYRDKKNLKLDTKISETEKESFRVIRTRLVENLENKKIIMLSGVNKKNLRSYVSFNLSRLLEKTNKRVLLIDINAKDGLITKSFLENKEGLLDAIENKELLNDVKYKVDNIDVIPLGNYDKIDLLASTMFKEVLRKLEKDYDYILIDSPSFNDNFEPYSILNLVDGVIISSTTSNKINEIYKIDEKIKNAGKDTLGIVFVKAKNKRKEKISKIKKVKKISKKPKLKKEKVRKKKVKEAVLKSQTRENFLSVLLKKITLKKKQSKKNDAKGKKIKKKAPKKSTSKEKNTKKIHQGRP